MGRSCLVSLLALATGLAHAQASEPASYRETSHGLLSRDLYATSEIAETSIVIRDILVGPGQHATDIRIDAPAVLQVRAGQASVNINGRMTEARLGQVLTLARGQRLDIDNRQSPRPFTARWIVIGPRP